MLTISTDTLPQTCLSYFAFRVSFQETLERIVLSQQMGHEGHKPYGFLTEVPFLRSVPPQVQLDLLAATWQKHISQSSVEASLTDESVVYAVCETAARVVDEYPDDARRFLKNGPLDVDVALDHFLATELRNLHLNLSNEGDFLLISQFEDMHPDEANEMKKQFHLDAGRLEEMFEVLGRWNVSPDFLLNLKNLLSEHELARVATTLELD